MGLEHTQALLARLFTDSQLREQFLEDPVAVGTSMGLDSGQAAALAALDPSGIQAFAESLDRKRRDDLAKMLPITTHALGRNYPEIFQIYVIEHPERHDHLKDALAFVEFLIKRKDTQLWLSDLARYERTFRQMSHPSRKILIRIFHYPVQQIASLVLQEQPVPLIAPQRTLAVWGRFGSQGSLWHHAISLSRWSRKVAIPINYSPVDHSSR